MVKTAAGTRLRTGRITNFDQQQFVVRSSGSKGRCLERKITSFNTSKSEEFFVEIQRGIKVTNVEIREIDPPRDIQEAMNREMTAERVRRAVVLEADGTKEAAITIAEGERQSNILKAEGERQAEILAAEGDQQAAVLRAQGYAEALQKIQDVAKGVGTNTMTLQYVEALKEIGAGDSTKIVLPVELTRMLGNIGGMTDSSD